MNNKKIPIISIIVPVYNVEKYVNRCIDSILNQTFTDFELILVDDGSMDSCGVICDEYAKKDKRIKVIHKKNGGLSSARNVGLDIAIGEYIGFIDSDDYVHPQMYEILYNKIVETNSYLSICNFERVYGKESLPITHYVDDIIYYTFDRKEVISELYGKNQIQFVVAWNKLYRKEIFSELRYDEGRYHEDEFIIHKVLYQCNKAVYIDVKLYNYYQREDSIMGSFNLKKSIDILDAFENRMYFFRDNNVNELINTVSYFYIVRFFKEYNILLEFDKTYTSIMRKRFLKNIMFFITNSKFNIKEKLSFLIFIINDNLYYKCIKI